MGLPEISVRNRRKRYKIRSNEFRVRKGKKVDLKKCPTVDPVYESKEQYEEILRRCYATFAAAGGYQSMRYNIAIGYDTAGLFFVSSSNVPSLKIRARSFKEIVEKATIASRRLLRKPSAEITFEPGIMVRNSSL